MLSVPLLASVSTIALRSASARPIAAALAIVPPLADFVAPPSCCCLPHCPRKPLACHSSLAISAIAAAFASASASAAPHTPPVSVDHIAANPASAALCKSHFRPIEG